VKGVAQNLTQSPENLHIGNVPILSIQAQAKR
jgi:hypothetical protein